jgi:uncharacterized protein (TIGR03435 family)
MGESTLIASTEKLTRQQLQLVPTPLGTATHRPVPHSEVVEALIETLGFRHIGVVKDEFAISKDGMKMFGVLDLARCSSVLPHERGNTLMIRAISGASLIVLMSSGVFGQSAVPPRAFEVASIKAHVGPLHTIFGFSSSGTRVTLEGYSPILLVMEAYKLKSYQVSFPAAFPQADVFYDIVAKAEGDGAPTRDEFRPMLQKLLAERFNLKLHHEMKEMPVYALVVGKNSPKFMESAPDATFSGHGGVNGRNQYMKQSKATMDDMVDAIRNFADRPVVDKTGLTGTYDYRIEATLNFRLRDGTDDPNDITIFSAVQDQLGLRLEGQRAMVEILVVDHMEKPSAN